MFDLLRYRHHDHAAVLCAFDLIELDGFDLRQQALERRKDRLADLLGAAGDGIERGAAQWSSSMPAVSAARELCPSA